MSTYYLAVDIGASSGRLIIAWKEAGKLMLEEVYRFQNGMRQEGARLCWDTEKLLSEIKSGLKECARLGKVPAYMGIDTWGVDFVLLNQEGELLGQCVGYRDSRTNGMAEKVDKIISREELYERTGIQKQDFNTLYQLMALKETDPDILKEAKRFLMMPEYLNYRLTGAAKNEYTNATTTQLVNAASKSWDGELMDMLGLPKDIFGALHLPGEEVGEFAEELQEEVGFSCKVLLPATHDTGSAVLAVPAKEEEILYISSGTWSLIGTERGEADCRPESMHFNFTNEGGYGYRFRYLKNIMGLWMIQSVKRELAQDMSFGEICGLASEESIDSIVDCNDERFMAPDSMTEAVRQYCRDTGQQVPEGIGQIASVIYNSLASSYKQAAEEIEKLTGKNYPVIHVIGGGSNAEYLNELTARYTGKKVVAGPGEATAIGNIMVQMIYAGEYESLEKAREAVRLSFPTKAYT